MTGNYAVTEAVTAARASLIGKCRAAASSPAAAVAPQTSE